MKHMLRKLCALFLAAVCLVAGSAAGDDLADWGTLEEEDEVTPVTETEGDMPSDDLAMDEDLLSDLDLDSFSLNGLETDEDLVPMSEEELLEVLAQKDQTDFLVIPEDSGIADTDLYTLLLIGTDAYEEDRRGRADTTILVQINADKKTIRMVSFLRDMYVAIPGRASNRLNAAYVWGGARLMRKTLKNNFGVEADAYMEVNFARLIRLIDGIGGIELDVSEEEQRQVNSILRFYNTYTGDPESDQLLMESGEGIHLTGKQALCYARIRKIDNDFARTQRQRKVIEAAFRKVMGLSMIELTQLVTDNLQAVTTDLSVGDIMKLIPMAIRCQNAEITTMTVPNPGTYSIEDVKGMSVIVPNIRSNRRKLKTFLAVE